MSLWGYFYKYTAGPSNHRFWAGRRKQEESYGLGPVHTSPQGVSSMWVIFNQADINQTVQSNEIQITVLGDAWIVLRSLIRRDWSWAGELKFQLYQNNSVGAKKRLGQEGVAIITQPLQTGYVKYPEPSSFEITYWYLQTELNRIKRNLVHDCHGFNLLGKTEPHSFSAGTFCHSGLHSPALLKLSA